MEKLYKKLSCDGIGSGYMFWIDFTEAYFENPKCQNKQMGSKTYVPAMIKGNKLFIMDQGKLVSYNLQSMSEPILMGDITYNASTAFAEGAENNKKREYDCSNYIKSDYPAHIVVAILSLLYSQENQESAHFFYNNQVLPRIKEFNKIYVKDGNLSAKYSQGKFKLFLNDSEITVEKMIDLFLIPTDEWDSLRNSHDSMFDSDGEGDSSSLGWGGIIILAIIAFILYKVF